MKGARPPVAWIQRFSAFSQGCRSKNPMLLSLAYFAFGTKKQIKRKPMAGVLAPESSQHVHAIAACQPVIRQGDQ